MPSWMSSAMSSYFTTSSSINYFLAIPQADLSQDMKEERKPGRPNGAWNQKRIDREVSKMVEATKRAAAQKVGERTVGRPKGRKNDKMLEKAAREKVMALIQAEQERLQRNENDA